MALSSIICILFYTLIAKGCWDKEVKEGEGLYSTTTKKKPCCAYFLLHLVCLSSVAFTITWIYEGFAEILLAMPKEEPRRCRSNTLSTMVMLWSVAKSFFMVDYFYVLFKKWVKLMEEE